VLVLLFGCELILSFWKPISKNLLLNFRQEPLFKRECGELLENQGVNFTNILCEAFMRADPKSAKNTVKSFFALLRSSCIKASSKMLVKLIQDVTTRCPCFDNYIHPIYNDSSINGSLKPTKFITPKVESQILNSSNLNNNKIVFSAEKTIKVR